MLWVILPALNFFFKPYSFFVKMLKKSSSWLSSALTLKSQWIMMNPNGGRAESMHFFFFLLQWCRPNLHQSRYYVGAVSVFLFFPADKIGKTTCIQLAFVIFWVRTDLYAHVDWDFFFVKSNTSNNYKRCEAKWFFQEEHAILVDSQWPSQEKRQYGGVKWTPVSQEGKCGFYRTKNAHKNCMIPHCQAHCLFRRK